MGQSSFSSSSFCRSFNSHFYFVFCFFSFVPFFRSAFVLAPFRFRLREASSSFGILCSSSFASCPFPSASSSFFCFMCFFGVLFSSISSRSFPLLFSFSCFMCFLFSSILLVLFLSCSPLFSVASLRRSLWRSPVRAPIPAPASSLFSLMR